jgi:hypothetical protein
VRPKPATWVHTATVSWLNKNDTANVANSFMEGSQYVAAQNPDNLKREGELMDALR